jgi:hypothetical protein
LASKHKASRLENNQDRRQPNDERKSTERSWVRRRIYNLKRNLHQRRTKKEKESPQDRFSRRTANATVAIAFLTAAAVLVAGGTYWLFERQLTVMQGQLNQMKDDTIDAKNRMLVAFRPWIIIPEVPTVLSNGGENRLALAITFKNTGPSPATNGQAVVRTLQTINPPDPMKFVKNEANDRPDCPISINDSEWATFNTMSGLPQPIIAAEGDVAAKSGYVLICARYEWSLVRSQRGIIIMLYELKTDPKPSLRLVGSFAG